MIFASNNRNKIIQVKHYLKRNDIFGLKEFGLNVDVEENCDTFQGNAIKKAKEIFELTHEEVISDDSGLCIDEFNGWPGVYTHRFLGENSTEKERNQYILDKMKDLPLEKRDCSVMCVIAYCNKNGIVKTFVGEFRSKISFEQLGNNFFGYDSIVYADRKYDKTISCLSDEEKLNINARSIALTKLNNYLKGNNNV